MPLIIVVLDCVTTIGEPVSRSKWYRQRKVNTKTIAVCYRRPERHRLNQLLRQQLKGLDEELVLPTFWRGSQEVKFEY